MKNNQFCIYFLPAYLLVILADDYLYKCGLLLVPIAFFLLGTGAALCSSHLRAESNRRLLIGFCVLSLILMVIILITSLFIAWGQIWFQISIRTNGEQFPFCRWFNLAFDYGSDYWYTPLFWMFLALSAVIQPGCFWGGIYWGKLMRK